MALNNYLEDDWNDNALSGRTSAEKDVFYQYGSGGSGDLLKGVYRPLWTIESGTPSATNQELQLSNGSTTAQGVKTTSKLSTGKWEKSVQFSANPSSGQNQTRLYDGVNPQYRIASLANDQVGIYDEVDAAWVILVSQTIGTAQNTITTTRDSYGNWELLYNGASKGTATDTTSATFTHLYENNTMDTRADVDNLVVK